ncbi:mutS protein homolog 5-like isoform X2 [Penaeus chinensis]|uniref:mutS protein homolog 5-like isoform X2 n=1 Tax=Penaeus chinensis TaxID=139456 RepID=UPI001FB5BC94|nr:mutS protein homolog 5-like isoform X2 [Penaeus chinensis]
MDPSSPPPSAPAAFTVPGCRTPAAHTPMTDTRPALAHTPAAHATPIPNTPRHLTPTMRFHTTPAHSLGLPPYATPARTTPSHGMPARTTPSHGMPARTTPSHGMSARTTPSHSTPAHPLPFPPRRPQSAPSFTDRPPSSVFRSEGTSNIDVAGMGVAGMGVADMGVAGRSGGSSSSSLMGVGAVEVQGGLGGRLARVLRSVPASALSGGQWARRGTSSSSNTPGLSTSHSTYFHTSSSTLLDSLRKAGLSGERNVDSTNTGNRAQNSSALPMPPPQPRVGGATLALTPGGHKDDGRLEVFGGPRGLPRKSRAPEQSPAAHGRRSSSSFSPSSSSSSLGMPQPEGGAREDLWGNAERDMAEVQDHSADEEADQVVMSMSWSQGKLGAAFYHISTSQVYMVEDKIEAAPDFWVLRNLFREQRPRWVLIGGRQDERLFSVLRELCGLPSSPVAGASNQAQHDPRRSTPAEGTAGEGGQRAPPPPSAAHGSSASPARSSTSSPSSSSFCSTPSCNMRVLPTSDFKYELCVRRVLSLSLPGEPQGLTEGDRELFVRGKINTDLVSMTRALGALLRFLDKHGAELLDGTTLLGGTPVLGVHYYSMDELAQLDDATVAALQLFSEDQHPSAFKSGKASSSKEGLSLYALLGRTASPMAAHALRRVLLRPVLDAEVLEARYAAVEWGVNSANMETLRHLHACLKSVTNVPHTMKRLQRGQLNVRDWRTLYKSLFNAILVGEICQAQDQDIPIFKEVSEGVTEGLYHATFLIQRIMDMEQSEREARFVVKPGVDPELDDKKRRFSGLGEVMRRVAEVELDHLPLEVDSCCIIYLPHVGYLLAFPPTPELDRSLNAHGYDLPGLEFMFRTSDMILYKSRTCHELDRELGDIQVDIANHETRIMMRLVETLLLQASTFVHLVQRILMLDCLLSFAVVSRECGWVRPQLTKEAVLEVEDARHPLYELCTPAFVANPIRSGRPNPCVTLITGPNASGKTVYLKQVGVIAVLAQIGCWVPAASARLRPFDVILAVTQSTPAVTSSLSAFMLDLTRMCGALARATRHSLVIIDEFGAATYENDGAALLTACLDHWAERARVRPRGPSSSPSSSQGPDEGLQGREERGGGGDPLGAPPHVFVSTHLLQVHDHLQYPEAVKCLVLEAVEESGSVVPLYQVAEGRARKSYAAAVASIAGVPQQVVDRANQVCECIRAGQLPPRWSLLDDDEEERRCCEEIVSLVLAFDPSCDAVDLLLERIRDIGSVSKRVLDSTPSASSRNETPRTCASLPSGASDVTPRFDLVETVMRTLGSGSSGNASERNTPEREVGQTARQEIAEEEGRVKKGQKQTASLSSITSNGHGAENPSSVSSSPAASPVTSAVASLVFSSVASPVVSSVASPVVSSIASPIASPVVSPVVSPVASPVVSPAASPVASPVVSPAASPVAGPVVSPAANSAASPVVSPVVSPVASSPSANITIPFETRESADTSLTAGRNRDEERTAADQPQEEAATPGSPHSSFQQTTEGTSSSPESNGGDSSSSSCGRESVVIRRRSSRQHALLSQPSQTFTQSFQVNSHAFLAFLGSDASKS